MVVLQRTLTVFWGTPRLSGTSYAAMRALRVPGTVVLQLTFSLSHLMFFGAGLSRFSLWNLNKIQCYYCILLN